MRWLHRILRRRRPMLPYPAVPAARRPASRSDIPDPGGPGTLRKPGLNLMADAVVFARENGRLWLLLVDRRDGHGWALPGGKVDDDDPDPHAAAVRELGEETGLRLYVDDPRWTVWPSRYVPDPRETADRWAVTVPSVIVLDGRQPIHGGDEARSAEWIPADNYGQVLEHMGRHGAILFSAHRDLVVAAIAAAIG